MKRKKNANDAKVYAMVAEGFAAQRGVEPMFESVDRELNSGGLNAGELSVSGAGAGTPAAEPGALLPANPRVSFLLAHGAAMDRWKTIPYQLGFVTAPLWDHRPGVQQAVIILAFISSSFLWTHLLRPWVEGRVGVFRPRVDIFRSRAAEFGLSKELVRRQRWQKAMYYAALLGVFLAIAFLTHAPERDFPTRGWMEHATGVWIVITVIDCVNRATDRTNLRARRNWNIAAAVVLACGCGFGGATANSYAALLMLLGVVNIGLALLDLGLLLHFAATPISLSEGEVYE